MSHIADSAFPGGRNLFLAFSTFTGDRGTFDAWYDEEHIPQILSAPGMVGAQRFVIDPTEPLPDSSPLDFGHLAMYEIDGDPRGFREEVKRQLMSGDMVIPEFMNTPFKTLILKPVSEAFENERDDESSDFADRHLVVEFTRGVGDHERFTDWYDNVYMAQLMAAPGVFRGQRFMQSEVKPLPGVDTPDVEHMTLLEIAGDLLPFRERITQLMAAGEIVTPDFVVQPFGTMLMRPVSRFITAVASEA